MGSVWDLWNAAQVQIIDGADPTATWNKMVDRSGRQPRRLSRSTAGRVPAPAPRSSTTPTSAGIDERSNTCRCQQDDAPGVSAIPRTASPLPPVRESHARGWRGLGWGFIVKLVLMMLVNALGILAIISAYRVESWIILGVSVVLLVIADIVYFSKRALPLEVPAAGARSSCSLPDLHLRLHRLHRLHELRHRPRGTQEQAVDAALIQGERRVEGSPTYPLTGGPARRRTRLRHQRRRHVKVGSEIEPLDRRRRREVGDTAAPTEVPGWNDRRPQPAASPTRRCSKQVHRPAGAGLGRPERRCPSAPATASSGADLQIDAGVG